MYVCLLDVAFGIEWFFLKAGGEGSDNCVVGVRVSSSSLVLLSCMRK